MTDSDVMPNAIDPFSREVLEFPAVMELLRELHRGGATICMVTHDPRYAEYADRTIRLFDGKIVEESVGAL